MLCNQHRMGKINVNEQKWTQNNIIMHLIYGHNSCAVDENVIIVNFAV